MCYNVPCFCILTHVVSYQAKKLKQFNYKCLSASAQEVVYVQYQPSLKLKKDLKNVIICGKWHFLYFRAECSTLHFTTYGKLGLYVLLALGMQVISLKKSNFFQRENFCLLGYCYLKSSSVQQPNFEFPKYVMGKLQTSQLLNCNTL